MKFLRSYCDISRGLICLGLELLADFIGGPAR